MCWNTIILSVLVLSSTSESLSLSFSSPTSASISLLITNSAPFDSSFVLLGLSEKNTCFFWHGVSIEWAKSVRAKEHAYQYIQIHAKTYKRVSISTNWRERKNKKMKIQHFSLWKQKCEFSHGNQFNTRTNKAHIISIYISCIRFKRFRIKSIMT